MLGQKRLGLVGEKGVHEHVLVVLRKGAELGLAVLERLGRQRRGGDVRRQDVGRIDDAAQDVGLDGTGRLAVLAAQVVLHLAGDDAPALAGKHVKDGLGADDLAHGGHERREADLGAHAGNLLHHVGQTVLGMLDAQLAHQVAHHAAGNLVLVDLHVDERGDATLVMAALAHLLPVLGDLKQQVEVNLGVVARLLEGGHDHLDGRLGVAEGQGGACGVDDVGTGLGALDVVGRGHATDIVAVQVDGKGRGLLERAHQSVGAVRREKAGHVLDADGVGTELLQSTRVVDVAVERVHGARGVRDGGLEMGTAGLDGGRAVTDVANVVERVEGAEHIDAVLVRRGNEAVHDVRGVVVVTHEVLATDKHGQRRVGRALLDGTQALPGVLVEEAQARVERGAAPCLDSPITDLVHLGQNGEHVANRHPRGPQGLLTVSDGRVHNLKWLQRRTS